MARGRVFVAAVALALAMGSVNVAVARAQPRQAGGAPAELADAERDHYEVLGVAKTANDEEIKAAYKKLARELHPDRHHNSPDRDEFEARFMEVANAYDVLKDPRKRREYDNRNNPLARRGDAGFPFAFHGFGGGGGGGGGIRVQFGGGSAMRCSTVTRCVNGNCQTTKTCTTG